MKKIIVLILCFSIYPTFVIANTGKSSNRTVASDLTPEEFEKLKQDPDVKKGVEIARKLFSTSGAFVFCTTPGDLGQSMALTFEGIQYHVAQMVTVPPTSSNSGQVCVAIEKPKN